MWPKKNRLVLFEDGSKACCRYRDGSNVNNQIQGELMSFYLGRLLGISNIPVVVLSEVKKYLIELSIIYIYIKLTIYEFISEKIISDISLHRLIHHNGTSLHRPTRKNGLR